MLFFVYQTLLNELLAFVYRGIPRFAKEKKISTLANCPGDPGTNAM